VFLLDTNVVSELRRPRPHGAVLKWISENERAQFKIAAVTVGEIQIGIERTRKTDLPKAAEIESWLVDVMAAFVILPMTADAFRIWAKLMLGKPAHLSGDAMIAATAILHGMTVASRNVSDFGAFSVPLVNPFVVA
jgi:predicted nucleic acid-binding protein